MRAFKLGGKAAKLGSVVAVVVGLSMASSGTAGASTDANYAFATTQSGLALTWGFPDSPFHFSFGSRAAVNVSFRVNGQAYAQGGFSIPAERGPSVTDPSTAYASSSHCQGCLTNAIAITVDVLSGPVSSVYAPTKAVATDNYLRGMQHPRSGLHVRGCSRHRGGTDTSGPQHPVRHCLASANRCQHRRTLAGTGEPGGFGPRCNSGSAREHGRPESRELAPVGRSSRAPAPGGDSGTGVRSDPVLDRADRLGRLPSSDDTPLPRREPFRGEREVGREHEEAESVTPGRSSRGARGCATAVADGFIGRGLEDSPTSSGVTRHRRCSPMRLACGSDATVRAVDEYAQYSRSEAGDDLEV